KTFSVTAAAAQTRQGSASVDSQEVRVALNPRPEIHLQTGLALKQTDQFQTTTATIGAVARPTSFLQFSALYRDRTAPIADTAASDTLDTGTAKVTLTPVAGLRLTGTYAQNPDTNGADPQRLAQRGVGLETSLGALSLTGGCDWSSQGQDSTDSAALRLGIGLRFSRALQLTGGYKQTLTGQGDAATGTSLYTVGLTHNLGDRFNLSMTGAKAQPLGPANTATPDYTANANLGMKF
nr:porin [Armatimonadota bacterium]